MKHTWYNHRKYSREGMYLEKVVKEGDLAEGTGKAGG